MSLRIVYMGTPEFAVAGLNALLQTKHTIVGVITAPDKPSGRGLKITPSPVKEAALANNLTVLQPVSLKDESFLYELKNLNADLFIVVAFRMLPEVVWQMPPMGTFNLHGSLLPKYRGAAPINWAIINGDTETGVTTFFLKHEIDTGDVILQEKSSITPEDTFESMYHKLMDLGAHVIVKTVDCIESKNYTLKQQLGQASHAPKLYKEDGKMNFMDTATHVHNRVRGLYPFPGSWFEHNEKKIKVYKTAVIEQQDNVSVGTIVSDSKNFIHVRCKENYIAILELQLEGKKRLSTIEFLRGSKL
jgi:methionyl-tRNA formyltransferase